MTINLIKSMHDALEEIDPTLLTKLIIYREMCDKLTMGEMSVAIDLVYGKWLRNEIWCDLMVFSKNVAQQWNEYDDKNELVDELIKEQGDLE